MANFRALPLIVLLLLGPLYASCKREDFAATRDPVTEPSSRKSPKLCFSRLATRICDFDLDSLLALRSLDRRAVEAMLGLARGQGRSPAAYEKLKGVVDLHDGSAHPAHFYFRDELLVMVYLGEEAALTELRSNALQVRLGPGKRLRSRAGKSSEMQVYPALGFAYSSNSSGAVELVEVFPPTTAQAYLDTIYRPVPDFIE